MLEISLDVVPSKTDYQKFRSMLNGGGFADIENCFRGIIEFDFGGKQQLRSEGSIISFYLSMISTVSEALALGRGGYIIVDYESFIFCEPNENGIDYLHYDPRFLANQESVGSSGLVEIRRLMSSLSQTVYTATKDLEDDIATFVTKNPYTDLRRLTLQEGFRS